MLGKTWMGGIMSPLYIPVGQVHGGDILRQTDKRQTHNLGRKPDYVEVFTAFLVDLHKPSSLGDSVDRVFRGSVRQTRLRCHALANEDDEGRKSEGCLCLEKESYDFGLHRATQGDR
ncbi:predicted protein [Histoplasma capsulatum var. duboisii H88]|uniref:Predicted protein n=1 Tax=Ajellomyces capsulatus (strain H88) TaxID=544711 RepID=F0UHW3_AJEC8|nr:predicted protein [Histoplasma capsulatum var. duboisii H88]